MLIRDLEIRSGLDRATIRFYEREGLITPERKENGYRDYTEENLNHLMKIKLLRQLGMSLDKIKQLQQGSVGLQIVLTEQIRILERQIKEAQQARLVCLRMQADRVSYGNMDVQHYLNVLQGPVITPVKKEFKEKVYREYHPIRRMLARFADYAFLSRIFTFVFVMILRMRPYPDWISMLVHYGVPFLMVPLGALMLHFWGTTPGKWCFGLRVESENGGKLSFAAALDREWDVLRYGIGFGIPIWNWWRLYKSYREYQERELDWDWESEYGYCDWSVSRKAAAAGAAAVWVLTVIIGANSLLLPKYRGDLTVSQFSSNYNHYLSVLDMDNDYRYKLQKDGLFPPVPNDTAIVYVFGKPEKENYSFDYITEGEKLEAIVYSNFWTSPLYIDPIPDQCMVAALTAVMSQEGSDRKTMMEFAELWDARIHQSDGSLLCNGVKVSWRTEGENCVLSSDGSYIVNDGSLETAEVVTEFRIDLP